VPDPCAAAAGLDLSIVDIGLVYDVTVDQDRVEVALTFTELGCQFTHRIVADVTDSVRALDGVEAVRVRPCWSPPWSPDRLSPRAVAALAASRRGYSMAPRAPRTVLLQIPTSGGDVGRYT
jgi:metal-sulfur cluster biosynthetic enzyme